MKFLILNNLLLIPNFANYSPNPVRGWTLRTGKESYRRQIAGQSGLPRHAFVVCVVCCVSTLCSVCCLSPEWFIPIQLLHNAFVSIGNSLADARLRLMK